MTFGDTNFMLELKNYSETRQFAIETKDEIKLEAHNEWMKKNILFFQVIDGSAGRVGAIRIFGNELSIWIDRHYWGLGIATEVIKRVSKPGMYAKIVDGNVASLRAFTKAGYLPVSHSAIDKYYLLQR